MYTIRYNPRIFLYHGPAESIPVQGKLEPQKWLNAKELHDDTKLAQQVVNISNAIAQGNITDAQKMLKNVALTNDQSLLSIVQNFDFQNRPTNGRAYTTTPTGATGIPEVGLIKDGSHLAKLLQLYVIAYGASVQKTDSQNTLKGVDGKLERFTIQGLSQLALVSMTQHDVMALKEEIDRNTRATPLKGMGVDFGTQLEGTGNPDAAKRAKRNLDIEIHGNILSTSSYGQTSNIDLSTGKITLSHGDTTKEYPLTVHLVRDRENNSNPIFLESDVNRKNIKNAMALMNFVHFVIGEFMNDTKKKSIRDGEKPFTVSGDHLQINDSMVTPTNIAKIKTLQKMLSDARTNTTQDPQILARFLNDIFRAKNQAELKDVGSTYVGGGKPIGPKK